MKVLHLTLKKKWFDMIASGEKKEEYREIKPYWINRFTWHEFHSKAKNENDLWNLIWANERHRDVVKERFYDAVLFKNGYGANAPAVSFKCEGIFYGQGKEEWGGDPLGNYFVIKLGEIIDVH